MTFDDFFDLLSKSSLYALAQARDGQTTRVGHEDFVINLLRGNMCQSRMRVRVGRNAASFHTTDGLLPKLSLAGKRNSDDCHCWSKTCSEPSGNKLLQGSGRACGQVRRVSS